jgi:hypothetical protein
MRVSGFKIQDSGFRIQDSAFKHKLVAVFNVFLLAVCKTSKKAEM